MTTCPHCQNKTQTCPQCQEPIPIDLNNSWQGVRYCSDVCRHAAGDRTGCHGWNCGCTPYAKKRRLLNAHREEMRIMLDLIVDEGLEDELEDLVIEGTGDPGFCLEYDPEGLDETSDCEDPMARVPEMRQGLAEREGFVQAAKDIVDSRAVATDMERARMQLEDFRSQRLRLQ